MTNEEHLIEFYDYVTKHGKEIKKALKKNITYNPEIFEDAYNEAFIKVCNAIMTNSKRISDFKQYFFIAAKYQYILRDNQNKSKQKVDIPNYFDDGRNDIPDECVDLEAREEDIYSLINETHQRLAENFGDTNAEMFMYYHSKKTRKEKINYVILREMYNIGHITLTKVMREMMNFVSTDTELLDKFKQIKNYADYQ